MSVASLSFHELKYEQRSYWRNPASAFFTFAFPLMFLVIFGSLNSGAKIDSLGGLKYNQYYIPGITAYGVMGACMMNLATKLSIRRDAGILKKMRATPLPATSMFGGLVLNSIVVSVLLVVITTVVGIVAYGVTFPGHYLALLVDLVLGAACFCAIGVAVSSLVPNADAAPAVVNVVFFPLLFISGVFYPVTGGVLSRIADVFPVHHFVTATFAAFDPRLPHGALHGFAGRDLLVMAVWAVGAGVVAVRRFRWEPRQAR